jgi:hypothetical protein
MTWHTTLKTENTELGGIEGEGPADHRITGITGSPRVLTPSKPWQYPYWVPNTLSITFWGTPNPLNTPMGFHAIPRIPIVPTAVRFLPRTYLVNFFIFLFFSSRHLGISVPVSSRRPSPILILTNIFIVVVGVLGITLVSHCCGIDIDLKCFVFLPMYLLFSPTCRGWIITSRIQIWGRKCVSEFQSLLKLVRRGVAQKVVIFLVESLLNKIGILYTVGLFVFVKENLPGKTLIPML